MTNTSWIIVSKETRKPVMETHNRHTASSANLDKYRVYTAHEWLEKFNAEEREQS